MNSTEYQYEDALLDKHLEKAMGELPIGHFKLAPFDELIGGIRHARFTVLCSEPGMAKTTLFGQLAEEAAAAGFVCLVNTLEVPPYQWVMKSIARLSGGALTVDDVADPSKAPLVSEMADYYRRCIAPNMVFVEQHLTPVELGAIIAAIQHERGQQVILWQDYLQLIPSVISGSSGQQIVDERLAVKEAVSGLRRIANVHDVPVFAISSINRANYAKRPCLAAMGSSSSVEYSADVVVSIYGDGSSADEVAYNMEMPVRPLVITTLKNRYGAKGTAKISFDCAHATFAERR